MIPLRARLSRLGAPRQHQSPCAFTHQSPRPRPFTGNTQLLAVSRSHPRPQLPFLSGVSRRKPLSARLISTEVKNNLKYQVRLGIYWTVLGWAIMGGLAIGAYVVRQDWLERQYPSPTEWHWRLKILWREAMHEIQTEGGGQGTVDWSAVGTQLRAVVQYCEDFKFFKHYPSGLKRQDSFDRTIPGLDEAEMASPPDRTGANQFWTSRIGYDITMKSEAWRRGYYEAMIGLTKAAEMRAGYMAYTKTGKVYAPEHVRSPENPYPKPISGTREEIELPDIEECVPVLQSPEFLYKRLLTTKGFTRKQRMDAGVAYAHWLEASGEAGLASQVYQWSLALALEGVPDASRIINRKTGVLRSSAPFVTPNILATATAIASFKARAGDVKAALPIFLSVLRARETAPPAAAAGQYARKAPDYSPTSVENLLRYARVLPFAAQFPDPPPTGDEPFERAKSGECEEAALMAYVGEILYARGGRRQEGLEWTRRAAGIAEEMVTDPRLDQQGTRLCEQCLRTSLGNWHQMVAALAQERREGAVGPGASWLGLGGLAGKLVQSEDWAQETQKVAARLDEYEERKLNERLNAYINGHSSWFVV